MQAVTDTKKKCKLLQNPQQQQQKNIPQMLSQLVKHISYIEQFCCFMCKNIIHCVALLQSNV